MVSQLSLDLYYQMENAKIEPQSHRDESKVKQKAHHNQISQRLTQIVQILKKNNNQLSHFMIDEQRLKKILTHNYNCFDQLQFIGFQYCRQTHTFISAKEISENYCKVMGIAKSMLMNIKQWIESLSAQLMKHWSDKKLINEQLCIQKCNVCNGNIEEIKVRQIKNHLVQIQNYRHWFKQQIQQQHDQNNLIQNVEPMRQIQTTFSIAYLSKVIKEMEEHAMSYEKMTVGLNQGVQFQIEQRQEYTFSLIEDLMRKIKDKMSRKCKQKIEEAMLVLNIKKQQIFLKKIAKLSIKQQFQYPEQATEVIKKDLKLRYRQTAEGDFIKDLRQRNAILKMERNKYKDMYEKLIIQKQNDPIHVEVKDENLQIPLDHLNEKKRQKQSDRLKQKESKKVISSQNEINKLMQSEHPIRNKPKKLEKRMSIFRSLRNNIRNSEESFFDESIVQDQNLMQIEQNSNQQQDQDDQNSSTILYKHKHSQPRIMIDAGIQWQDLQTQNSNFILRKRKGLAKKQKNDEKQNNQFLTEKISQFDEIANIYDKKSKLVPSNDDQKFIKQNDDKVKDIKSLTRTLTESKRRKYNKIDNQLRYTKDSFSQLKDNVKQNRLLKQYHKKNIKTEIDEQNIKTDIDEQKIKIIKKKNHKNVQNKVQIQMFEYRVNSKKIKDTKGMGLKHNGQQIFNLQKNENTILFKDKKEGQRIVAPHKKQKNKKNTIFKPEHLNIFGGVSQSYQYENKTKESKVKELDMEEKEQMQNLVSFILNLKNFKTNLFNSVVSFIIKPYTTIEQNQISYMNANVSQGLIAIHCSQLMVFHKKRCGNWLCDHMKKFCFLIGISFE